MITIYGASDDLIEVEGDIDEEFEHYGPGPWVGLLAGPEYGAMHVRVEFIDGMWAVGVSMVELAPGEESGNPIPPWPITIRGGRTDECEYSAVIEIDAPPGSELTAVTA